MYLSFDLKTTNLMVEVDDQELNLQGEEEAEELFIGGVHGPTVLAQMEHQYREDKMDAVAAAIMIAIQLRTAPTSETTAKVVIDLMAAIANTMLLDSDLPTSPDASTFLQRVGSVNAQLAAAKITKVAS